MYLSRMDENMNIITNEDNSIEVTLPSGKNVTIECCPICREPAKYLNDYTIVCSNPDCDLAYHNYLEYHNKNIWESISKEIGKDIYYHSNYIHKNVKGWNKVSKLVQESDDHTKFLRGMCI